MLALNESLTASDGTLFRFGVDSDGNYGYIVTDSEGADSVVPFKKNSGTPQKYPEILTYQNYQNVSIKSPIMATLMWHENIAAIIIANKSILYQNTHEETIINMGFSYDATTDTLTLVDYSSGGRGFELYYCTRL